jgi:hypothetical protein
MGPKPVGPQSNDMFRQRLDELVNVQHPLASHVSSPAYCTCSTPLPSRMKTWCGAGWRTRIGSYSAAKLASSTARRLIPVRCRAGAGA